MVYPVGNAVFQWEEGFRNLEEMRGNPRAHRALGRMVLAVQDELRKRLGSSFTVRELASLYGEGTDWGFQIAIENASDIDPTWDTATVVDAAFYLYMREATDFGGGLMGRRAG